MQASNSSNRIVESAGLASTYKAIVYQLAFPPQLNGHVVFPSVSDKLKLFAEIRLENSNFVDSGSSLHAFPQLRCIKSL